MNREIKFEYGFESVNGIVKKVYSLSDIPNIKEKCDVWNVLPIVYVREYTGLKDKNGKEIYEGDVIIHPGFSGTVQVKFIDGCCWTLSGWDCWRTDFSEGEVIGNIHQNPELL